MTLEDQIYSLLCPEGADAGTCNWARKKAGEIVGLASAQVECAIRKYNNPLGEFGDALLEEIKRLFGGVE